VPTSSLARTLAQVAGAAALALSLAACAPTPFPGVTTGTTPATGAPTATPSDEGTFVPIPTPTPTEVRGADEMRMPAACEQAYSAQKLAELQGIGPLNDPGITLLSSRLAPALELIEGGAPTLRCTWGAPGQPGLSTNITTLDPEQVVTMRWTLLEQGFGCEDAAGGTICSIQSQTVDFDGNLVTQGEIHYLRGDGWIATAWINVDPAGYTEDIAATLWA